MVEVGNYILYNNNKVRIEVIENNNKVRVRGCEESFEITSSHYIKLSPKILYNLGFKKDKYIENRYSILYVYVEISENDNSCKLYLSDDSHNMLLGKVEYVHELQNLWKIHFKLQLLLLTFRQRNSAFMAGMLF